MRNLKKSVNKIKIINLLGFVIFTVIAVKVFSSLTYMFRENQYTSNDRIAVVGIKEEKKNSLDVVCIGGSATFVYWEPLKAFNDYGFTSYDLATNTIQAESILSYVKYAQKYQNPDLYVIGVRAFQYYSQDGDEVGLRVTTDALDLGVIRNQLITQYINNRTIQTDAVSLYCDLAKYHINYDALKNPISWQLKNNTYKCNFKGHQPQTEWCNLQQPVNFQNEKRADLAINDRKVLIELLDYLNENDINALFVVCPYYISAEEYSVYNSIGDIVQNYGYNYLNMNDYYAEMGIDFSEDFYNINHVNTLGAEKYTKFLGDYIKENYDLPDHRNQKNFLEWQELAGQFDIDTQNNIDIVKGKMAYAKEGVNRGRVITAENDFSSWGMLVSDDRYTLCVFGNSNDFENVSQSDKKVMELLGVGDLETRKNYINVISASNTIIANLNEETVITTDIGQSQQPSNCTIINNDSEKTITIDDVKFSKNLEGINVLVFDNSYKTIIDFVTLKYEDNHIVLER